MKDPHHFDDDDWFVTLGRGDQGDFEETFKEKYREIDLERARTSLEQRFEREEAEEHRLFKAVVDAFSPVKKAVGSDSGFETAIINPLYEVGLKSSEILLAKKQVRSVHLCFVSCEVGGETFTKWRENINEIESVFKSDGNRQKLKKHLDCVGLNIKTVQYLTITRDRDLVDVDIDLLKLGTTPDNYAVWKLMERELGESEKDEEKQLIKYHDGNVEHPDLLEVATDGIEYTLVDNDDIRYALTSHPIIPIGEVFLQIYLNQLGKLENPKEFNEDMFSDIYKNKIQLGENRDEAVTEVENLIEELLGIALDSDMIQDEGEEFDTNRDYRLVWDSDEPNDIKDMVRRKFFNYKAPEHRGELAFKRARDDFERKESQLDDYPDSNGD